MIGAKVTGQDGKPLAGVKLSDSSYQPDAEVLLLWKRCQDDYGRAWQLQHRPFDEFDGLSLLQRAKEDQRTFGAYVGAEYIPKQKAWRWRGRKNTARNKLIGLLAHMIAGMLYPMVYAQNQEDEEDKVTAQVMRILVEEHLRKANYQMQFMYMALSALVNPAVFVSVEYVVAIQRIKDKAVNGKVTITEALDTLLTGLNLDIIPIDQLLLADFYIGDIQRQPYIIRVNRISYDQAREVYGDHDDFQYVEAGKTRVVMTGSEHATLYSLDWTEADVTAVQEITFYYRAEDLEVTWVGGVFMGSKTDVYNTNPFKHRRMSLIGDEWKTIPVYPIAKSGFEPIDPTGRFTYFKSAAFKEYWDDAGVNKAHQLLRDGMYLDVIKPILGTGIQKVDANVLAPGAYITTPNKDATLTAWSMGSNLPQAMAVLQEEKNDMSESTLSSIMQGQMGSRQTAYAVNAALTNAKIILGLFSFMMADLVRQVGELTIDVIVSHTTQGELDATLPEALNLKFRTILVKSKDKGRDITNKIVFTDALLGKKYTPEQARGKSFDLLAQAGGLNTDQRIFEVNPYRFARTIFTMWVDPDKITASAIGLNRDQKMQDITMLTQPFVYPFVDQQALANEVIEEYGGNDSDKLKKKPGANDAMQPMNPADPNGGGQPNPGAPVASPIPSALGGAMVGPHAGVPLPMNHPNR